MVLGGVLAGVVSLGVGAAVEEDRLFRAFVSRSWRRKGEKKIGKSFDSSSGS